MKRSQAFQNLNSIEPIDENIYQSKKKSKISNSKDWLSFKNKRKFHRRIVLIVAIPLFITVFSAFFYRFSHSVFGKERKDVRFWIAIHQVKKKI